MNLLRSRRIWTSSILLLIVCQTVTGGMMQRVFQRYRRLAPSSTQTLADTMFNYSDSDAGGTLDNDELTTFFMKGLGLEENLAKLLTLASLIKGDSNGDGKLTYDEAYGLLAAYNQ